MDENPSVDETIIPSDESVEETTAQETVETPAPEEKTYSKEEWDTLHGRATKAEAELKALRPKAKVVPASTQFNVEETVLLANGMSEELLGELKAVAQVRKTSLIKAQNDPIFVAVKEKFEKDQKQKDSSLPASRGSGSAKVKKTFNTPGLSRDEHKKMVIDSR